MRACYRKAVAINTYLRGHDLAHSLKGEQLLSLLMHNQIHFAYRSFSELLADVEVGCALVVHL